MTSSAGAAGAAGRRSAGKPGRPRRLTRPLGRRGVAAVALAGAAVAFAAQRGTWVRGMVAGTGLGAGPDGSGPVTVDGVSAAPGLGALALVVAAAAGALLLAGPRTGRLLGVVLALAGSGLVVSTGAVWVHPDAALAAEAERASAVTSVSVSDVRRAPPLPLAALAGAAVVVAGLAALATARSWPGSSTRYQRVGRDQPGDGAGPTGGRGPGPPDRGRGTPAPEQDPHRVWDALDRGEDPTRRTTSSAEGAPAAAAPEDLPE